MLGRRRRAKRCNRVMDARLMQAHNVHVAFNDQETLQGSAALTSLVKPVELAAFVKERGFRGI